MVIFFWLLISFVVRIYYESSFSAAAALLADDISVAFEKGEVDSDALRHAVLYYEGSQCFY